MNELQFTSLREEALASLAHLLPSYADLQTHYTSQVHMPDYRAFSDRWESSLYVPIRVEIGTVLGKRAVSEGDNLLYCAPGPHAPLLREVGEGSLSARFGQITLLDIDAGALRSAKQRLLLREPPTRIDTAALDFSGPFGQRLCDIYLDSLSSAKTGAEIAEFLTPTDLLSSSIFHDSEQVFAQLLGKFDAITGGQRYTCTVSEMVACFTGTAVWLAFRSALYERFAGEAPVRELDACLSAATMLWQSYNEYFFAFHLDFLAAQTRQGGFTALVFDTCKIYDQPELTSLPALRSTAVIEDIMNARQLRIARRTTISWRDHPHGVDVSLYGIPVSDFYAHTHDVQLYFVDFEG
jgi:hypothetical protein